MSAQLSAPHSTAASAMTNSSTRSCRALSARGSCTLRKNLLNLPIRLPPRFGSRPQNPSCRTMQYSPQTHMRFPCPCGEGLGVGVVRLTHERLPTAPPPPPAPPPNGGGGRTEF